MLAPAKHTNVVVVEHTPGELMRRLVGASDDEFTIQPTLNSARCGSCGNVLREKATDCWACGKLIESNFDGFVVKLIKSGWEAHGLTGSLLAAVNPVSLKCKLHHESGNGNF